MYVSKPVQLDVLKLQFKGIKSPNWSDLREIIKKACQASFPLGLGYLSDVNDRYIKTPLDNKVIAYWVKGGSEGHWVHVHEMIRDNLGYTLSHPIILVKVLAPCEIDTANRIVNFIAECCEEINEW